MSDFDTAERLAIVEEWKRQKAAWKPKEYYGAGCLMLLGAVIVLFGMPQLNKVIAMPQAVKLLGFALIPILGIGGYIVMQTRVIPGDPRQIAGDAARLLASGTGDPAARRQAAVALLFHAWDQRGPTLSTGYDHAAARQEAGAGLEYLQAVEQVLKEELKIAPVFTT